MNFEEFKQRLIDWMNERYEAEFECHEVLKNNGIHPTGIIGRLPGQDAAPNIYINELYTRYQMGMTFEAAASIVEVEYVNAKPQQFGAMNVSDFAEVKNKIVMRLINQELNSELLKSVPYVLVASNMAVTYRILYNIKDTDVTTALIDNQIFEDWNISPDELHQLALQNTERIFPAQIDSLKNMILKKIPEEMQQEAREELEAIGETEIEMYVLTNDSGINGAATILYPSVQEHISKEFGNILILPSSVHELMLVPHPMEDDLQFFKNLVKEANETAVGQSDFLSNSIYRIEGNELVNVNQYDSVIEQAIEEGNGQFPEEDLELK